MENNNFQNDANSVKNVNDVTENVNAENKNIEKEIKKGKRKTVVLIIILLILVLILGLVGGILISGNGNKVVDNIIHITDKKDENKTGKKIDESKDWVYDAEYLKDKKEIVKTNKDNNLTFKSTNEITLPYININSDDAKKVNEEIKKIAENAYADFGAPLQITNGLTGEVTTDKNSFSFTGYSYESYVNNNILSVVIKVESVAVPGDGTVTYITYNFNLDTLKIATLEEVGKACGFSSKTEIKEKINVSMKNAGSEAGIFEDTAWDGKRFFIDKNGKLNIVLPGPALTEITLDVDKDATINDKTTKQSTEAEYIAILNKINENNFKIMGIDKLGSTYDYDSYKITNYRTAKSIIDEVKKYKLEEKDIKSLPEMNHITISYDNTNVTFHYNDNDNAFVISKGGEVENDEYKCWISDNNDISGLKQIVNECIKNNKTSKIVKKLSPSGWAGSSMQEVRLFDNGDVYYVTYNGEGKTEDNVIISELIAKNADTIEEKINGQAVEAIIVKGKNLNVVKNNESWIIFENN